MYHQSRAGAKDSTTAQDHTTSPDNEQPAEPKVLHSAELFAGQRVVIIEHAGQRYRLLVTRNDRLILQK